MNIENNIKSILQSLPKTCSLIAVTKTHPPEKVLEAYNAGHRKFGENKVQELTQKYEALPKDIEWHMIGHLQSNKVKFIVPFVSLIHGVDSLKLLVEINKQAKKVNRVINCLLQVHIADEETKFGFSENELLDLISSDDFKKLNFIKVNGLMGMATLTDDKTKISGEFKKLKSLFEKIKSMQLPENIGMKELSMGMSSDYKLAVDEGSSMVRVGSAIFGTRNYNSI